MYFLLLFNIILLVLKLANWWIFCLQILVDLQYNVCYSPFHNSRVWEYKNRSGPPVTVHLSVSSSARSSRIRPWWLDYFVYNWYHDQVPWFADAGKIEFVSVLNLSNCGQFTHISCHSFWAFFHDGWLDFSFHIW